MKIIKTKFHGLKIIKHFRNVDKRGSLRETFNKKMREFAEYDEKFLLLIKN